MPRFELNGLAEASPVPSCVYRIVITQMSGDADSSKEIIFDFAGEVVEKAVEFAVIVDAIRSIQLDGETHSAEDLQSKVVIRTGLEVSTDTISGICGYDTFYEGDLSIVESMELYWFNEFGTKFHVKMVDY